MVRDVLTCHTNVEAQTHTVVTVLLPVTPSPLLPPLEQKHSNTAQLTPFLCSTCVVPQDHFFWTCNIIETVMFTLSLFV